MKALKQWKTFASDVFVISFLSTMAFCMGSFTQKGPQGALRINTALRGLPGHSCPLSSQGWKDSQVQSVSLAVKCIIPTVTQLMPEPNLPGRSVRIPLWQLWWNDTPSNGQNYRLPQRETGLQQHPVYLTHALWFHHILEVAMPTFCDPKQTAEVDE